MGEIVKPVNKELLKAELTEGKHLRTMNKSNNQVYIITHQNASNIMREVGRLREVAFHAAGGGTSLSMDIDKYDAMEHPYKQLIVWNPETKKVLGGHRYLLGADVRSDEKGALILTTSHTFRFSDTFIKEYLPRTIELGRSFVTFEYQSTRAEDKGLLALDNLWDGLGALTVVVSDVKCFFSEMTMYPSYHRHDRGMILHFLRKRFYDKEKLVTPIEPLKLETSEDELSALFCKHSLKEDYEILDCGVRKLGYSIPPLVNAYMSLSPTMRMSGTAINYEFGDVEETGVLIIVDEILGDKRIRHIRTFIESHPDVLRLSSCEGEEVFIPKMVTPQADCSR